MANQRTAVPRPAPGQPCTECGQEHLTRHGTPACMGHRRFDRETRERLPHPLPCRNNPRPGLERCDKHGAGSQKVAEAGKRRIQRAKVETLMLTLGSPVEGLDPSEIITERIAARLGHVRWLHARVQALEPDALTWGMTRRKTAVSRGSDAESEPDTGARRFAGTDEGDTHEAKPNIWYAMYVESAHELERLCIDAIRVGLDERRVRIDERMADMWVRIIDGMLLELGHDPNDPATAEIVARHLALVA